MNLSNISKTRSKVPDGKPVVKQPVVPITKVVPPSELIQPGASMSVVPPEHYSK